MPTEIERSQVAPVPSMLGVGGGGLGHSCRTGHHGRADWRSTEVKPVPPEPAVGVGVCACRVGHVALVSSSVLARQSVYELLTSVFTEKETSNRLTVESLATPGVRVV